MDPLGQVNQRLIWCSGIHFAPLWHFTRFRGPKSVTVAQSTGRRRRPAVQVVIT